MTQNGEGRGCPKALNPPPFLEHDGLATQCIGFRAEHDAGFASDDQNENRRQICAEM